MIPLAEYLNVVNEKDEVIGSDLRKNIHASGKWHKGIHVLLFNSKGEMLLQKRGDSKDVYPGCWECAISGHVDPDESYEDTAYRELKEELGISGVKLKKLVKYRAHYAPTDNMIVKLLECTYDGPIKVDKNETQEIRFCSIKKLGQEIEEHPEEFTFWLKEIFKWYTKKPSSLVIME